MKKRYLIVMTLCSSLWLNAQNFIHPGMLQIVGYLISGDPTYITGYQNARSLICRIDRDELLEELVQFYLSKNV